MTITKRDLYTAVRTEALAAESKAEQFRNVAKANQQQAEYWQEQAKCARGLLHRLDSEASAEEKTNGKS